MRFAFIASSDALKFDVAETWALNLIPPSGYGTSRNKRVQNMQLTYIP